MKSIFHQKPPLHRLLNTNAIDTIKTIYMANAMPTRNCPTQKHCSTGVCVGFVMVRFGSVRFFRYQHVGIGNAKVLCLGCYPTRRPNARVFAFWCNIGLRSRKFYKKKKKVGKVTSLLSNPPPSTPPGCRVLEHPAPAERCAYCLLPTGGGVQTLE